MPTVGFGLVVEVGELVLEPLGGGDEGVLVLEISVVGAESSSVDASLSNWLAVGAEVPSEFVEGSPEPLRAEPIAPTPTNRATAMNHGRRHSGFFP